MDSRNFIKFLGTDGARFVMARQLRSSAGVYISMKNKNIILDPGPGTLVKLASSKPRIDVEKKHRIRITPPVPNRPAYHKERVSALKKMLMGALIVVLFMFAGCAKSDKTDEIGQVKPNQEELMNQYQLLINENRPVRELTGFIESNKTDLNQENLDKTIMGLIEVQETRLKSYDDRLFSPEINKEINKYRFEDLILLRNIKEDNISNLLQEAYNDGYKLAASEGMYYFEVDFGKIMKDFGSYASDETAGYLEIMAEEYGSHTAVDAALVISPDELANRIVRTEKYIKRYPAFARIEQVQQFHRNYLRAYLLGLDNTPLFDYQSKKAKEYYLQSYEKTALTHRGTELAAIAEDYQALLKKSDYMRSEEIMNFVNRVTSAI
jgi:outer membrane murein-binding lipoprotein Lpp